MFSVTYTGMNFLPLCTAIVCPTISGMMVERRDQVRNTFFSLREFMPSMRDARYVSTKAPFLLERIKSFVETLLATSRSIATLGCKEDVASYVSTNSATYFSCSQ